MVEYALLAGLIAIALITALTALETQMYDLLNGVADAIGPTSS